MKKVKNIFKSFILISILGLSACAPETNSSIVVPQFDPNDYKENIENDIARSRIINTIENISKIDEMKVTSDVKNLEYGNSLLDMSDSNNFKKEATKGKFKQINNISGLTATRPEDILATYTMKNIELSIEKPGICPNEDDHIEMMNGEADYYVKDNKQYVDFSNQTLRDFLPYVLFGFGNYKTIEDAENEAKNVPEKFYLPDPVFKKEDLPLGGGFSNLKKDDMIKAFNYVVDLNNETQPNFLTFKQKEKDLLMNIDLRGSQIRDLLVKIIKDVNPEFDEKPLIAGFNSYVTVNACDMYFIIDKNDHLIYQNINIDFNIKSMQKDDSGKDFIKKDYSVLDMESFIEYKNVLVKFPKDLDKYVMYDLQLPNLPELPIK